MRGGKRRLRLTKGERRAIIAEAIWTVARRDGPVCLNSRAVAEACSVPTSVSTVKNYFGTRRALIVAFEERRDSYGGGEFAQRDGGRPRD